MADNFFPGKGCIYTYDVGSGGGPGFYSLAGLPNGKDSVILIQGVDVSVSDLIAPQTTLDDKRFLYLFGKDFGNVVINGLILLGPRGSSAQAYKNITQWFRLARVSENKKPVNVSLPGNTAIKVYIHGLLLGSVDPEFHTQQFVLRGLRAPLPKK
jgi:hypothetical protein